MTIGQSPILSGNRIRIAYAIAILADLTQIMLGPLGWTAADEIIDVLAMAAISVAVGFHPLFLPTFIVELVPVVDMLPTWTGCVALVISMRRKQKPASAEQSGPVIDV